MAKRGRPKKKPATVDPEEPQISIPSEKELAPKRIILSDEAAEDQQYIFSDLQDLSENEKIELAKFACDQIRGVLRSSTWASHLKMIEYSWDAYENKVEARTLPFAGAPNVRVDMEASIVDGYVARQLAGNFSVSPFIGIEGNEASDVPKAPGIEGFMHWWHTKKMDLYDIAEYGFQRKAVVGHHVSKLVYACDIERIKKIRDMAEFRKGKEVRHIGRGQYGVLRQAIMDGFEPTGEVKKVLVDENEHRHVGPQLVTVPETDYIFPIETTGPDQKPRWEAHQMWYTADDIIRESAQKFFFRNAWDKIKAGGPQKRSVIERETTKQTPEPAQSLAVGEFRVVQWYGKYRRKSDPYARTYLLTVHLDTETLCRAQYHPYDHGNSIFHHNRLFVGRSFWGFGVPWAIRHLSWVSSEMVNQMLESSFLANSLNFKYNKKRYNPSDETYMPGKGVGVENMDDVQEFNIGGRRVLMDLALLRSLREMATARVGHGRLQSGQGDPNQKTARGVIALLKEGSVTFDRTIRADQRWMEGVANQEVQLFQQFLPLEGMRYKISQDMVGRLFNREMSQEELFSKMSREEIQGQYDFTAMGSSNAAMKELDLQLNSYLYGILKDNLVVRSHPPAYYKLTKDLIDSARKKTKILPTLEEFLQSMQKQQQQGQQQQQATTDQTNQAVEYLRQQGASEEEIGQVISNMQQEQPQPAGEEPTPTLEGA